MENDLGANWTMTPSHQDNFSWVPNFHWDPLNVKKTFVLKLNLAIGKCMVSMATHGTILKNGGVFTKSTVCQLLLNQEY